MESSASFDVENEGDQEAGPFLADTSINCLELIFRPVRTRLLTVASECRSNGRSVTWVPPTCRNAVHHYGSVQDAVKVALSS